MHETLFPLHVVLADRWEHERALERLCRVSATMNLTTVVEVQVQVVFVTIVPAALLKEEHEVRKGSANRPTS
uniref:Uncharacterized protein n=1 Tax=Peronospora matthiolae TaxID=2874970 RepID=A0AAV1VL65_9STRA